MKLYLLHGYGIQYTIFQLYRGGQFIGEGNQSTWRKPQVKIYHINENVLYSPRHERDLNSQR